MSHPIIQLEEYLERPRGLPKLARDLGNTKQRFEKEASMAKTVLAPKSGPASFSAGGAASPSGGVGDSQDYSKDEFFGDDPFATGNPSSSSGGDGTSNSQRRTAPQNKSMIPTDFRQPGMAPPDLPGPDAELPDYDHSLVSEVRFRGMWRGTN